MQGLTALSGLFFKAGHVNIMDEVGHVDNNVDGGILGAEEKMRSTCQLEESNTGDLLLKPVRV